MEIVERWKNSRAVIGQIRAGEWVPLWNRLDCSYITAERDGKALWLGNGPFFCDVSNLNAFGLLLRHYVWYAAARKLVKDATKKRNHKGTPVLY